MDGGGDTPQPPLYRISCTEMPQELLLKSTAKQYFSQYGRIQRVIIKHKSRICVVEYATEKGMQLALSRAGEYNGQTFKVERDFRPIVKKKRTKKETDPDWTLDPDVQHELEAMKGTMALNKDYELRSSDMQVDEVSVSAKPKLVKAAKNRKSLLRNKTSDTVKPKKLVKSDKNLPPEQEELIKIIKQTATTVEEKFKILEARDKLIRLRTKKYTDLTKAKVTVGTCPDMCPEKERLMRETQHQISLYEQETGGKGMNPCLAVKQYSRSSADQEVPLPHELRPVSVLRMTMTYLMAKIMNLCDTMDVNFAEWYHFLWDRTRGIRKDITQQELCSTEAVELVEQCARFHIHCSARLVGEDPSVFDQKINTENLTKCLQTLKYMYHDLELKGIYCENESEFRAYIILLNLNDGNFMWEVQQLRQEIQKSPPVRFALQVYSALDKNNYVRFFKLVHSTTYLNACILLRYFMQVRLCALKVILKCFSPRQPYKSYPLSELTEILAFESVTATIDFLEYHGLVLSEDRTHVILDRRLFGMPEYPYVIDRAINVIESKKTCSVGEVVSGGHLNTNLYENHVPQNSFDHYGRLNVNEILTQLNITLQEDLESKRDVTDAPSNVFAKRLLPEDRSRSPMLGENKTTTPITGMFAAASESIFGKTKSIFGAPNKFDSQPATLFNVPQEKQLETIEPAMFTFQTEQNKQTIDRPAPAQPKPDLSQILQAKLEKEREALRKRERELLEIKRKQQEELERKRREELEIEKQARIERAVSVTIDHVADKSDEILLEKLEKEAVRKRELLELKRKQQEADDLKRKQQQEELERKRREELEMRKQAEIERAVTVTIDHLLNYVEDKIKTDKLKDLAQRVANRKVSRFFKIWRETVQVKRKKRKAVDYCFAWLMPRSTREEAAELRTQSEHLVLSDIKRYKLGKTTEIPIPKPVEIKKLSIHEMCYNYLLSSLSKHQMKFPKELFWKVTISLPETNDKHVNDTLNACIGWRRNNGVTFVLEQKKTANQNVTYCVERRQGLKNCKTDSNAFIFISNEHLHKRIYNTMVHFGQNTPTPTVLILQNPLMGELRELEEQGLLQNYTILNEQLTSKNLVGLVQEALQFLAQNQDKPPPLELETLQSFLSLYLAGDIWRRISGLAKWNSSYRDCLKNPQIAIKIHNDNLDKLKEIIFDEQRKEFAVFPEVFTEYLINELPECLPCDYKYFPKFWRSPSYETRLKNTLDTFYLSDYTNPWPPQDERVLEQNMYSYCEKNFKHPQKVFYTLMSVVLKEVDPENNFDDLNKFLWTNFVEAAALEKITETDFEFTDQKSVFNQLFVVYNSELLGKYCASSWFYVNYPPIRLQIRELMGRNQRVNEGKKRKACERFSLELDVDLDEMLKSVTKKIMDEQERDLQRRRDVQQIKAIMSDLKGSLEIQKKINETIQDQLKLALEDN